MRRSRRRRLGLLAAPWACAWLLGAAAAQAAETAPPPSNPFGQYQRWRDAPLEDWRAYLREAQHDGDAAGQPDPGAPGDQATR